MCGLICDGVFDTNFDGVFDGVFDALPLTLFCLLVSYMPLAARAAAGALTRLYGPAALWEHRS